MDEPIDPAFLRDSELFENQSAEVTRAVLAQGQLLEFGPGAVVFRQGEEGDRLFVVKSGVLEVVATPTDGSEPTVVAYLGTGEVIGELALLTGSPRSATRSLPGARRAVRRREGGVPRPDGRAARLLPQPVRGAREAARDHDAQGAARLGQAAPGQPALLRPRHGDPDADRLAPDGRPGGDAGQAQARRDLLLPRQHRAGALPPAGGRRRGLPAVPEPGRGRLLVHRPRGARGRGAERGLDARDLAADGVGADAGRAADAARSACRTPSASSARRPPSSPGTSPSRSSWRRPSGPASRRARASPSCMRDVPRSTYSIYRTVAMLLENGQIQ